MPDFTKKIHIGFDVNENDVSKVQKIVEHLQKSGNISAISVDAKTIKTINDLSKELSEQEKIYERQVDHVHEIQSAVEETSESVKDGKTSSFMKMFSEEFKSSFGIPDFTKEGLTSAGVSISIKAINSSLDFISDQFSKANESLSEMVNYSRLTDSSVREQAFKYGLSSEQNYALTKALQSVGVSDYETLLMWGDETQRKRFNERFEHFMQSYDTSLKYEELNYKWQDAQTDFQDHLRRWLIDNDESITKLIDTGILIAEDLMNLFTAVGSLVTPIIDAISWIAGTNRSNQIANAVTGSIQQVGGQTINNFNFDTTMNGISPQNAPHLSNYVTHEYEQVIQSLTRGARK